MIRMQVAQAAAALQARCSNGDAEFLGCSTDSRSCGRQQLFVALEGPNHDGHEHVAEAERRGAAAALVSRTVNASLPLIRAASASALNPANTIEWIAPIRAQASMA